METMVAQLYRLCRLQGPSGKFHGCSRPSDCQAVLMHTLKSLADTLGMMLCMTTWHLPGSGSTSFHFEPTCSILHLIDVESGPQSLHNMRIQLLLMHSAVWSLTAYQRLCCRLLRLLDLLQHMFVLSLNASPADLPYMHITIPTWMASLAQLMFILPLFINFMACTW